MAAAVDSTDRKAQAGLLADMAELNFRGRPHRAMPPLVSGSFSKQFADVPCHAGMTSDQWLAAFPDGDALRREVNRPGPRLAGRRSRGEQPDSNENPLANRGPRSTCSWAAGPAGRSLPTTP